MTAVMAALAVGGLLVAACGSTSASPTTTRPPTTTTSVPTPIVATPTTVIDGHAYTVPTDVPGRPINRVETGTQIILTPKGFLPFQLFAPTGKPIVWTNLTSTPVRIRFEYSPVRSPVIPPGGTFTYSSPTSDDLRYQSSTGYVGVLAIGAFP